MADVKICGINSEAALDAAVDGGADWIGFVFFTRSPRYVTAARAAALSARASGGPHRVGLFVNPTAAEIAAVLNVLELGILQIYGPPALAAAMREKFGLPVWQPVGVASAHELPSSLNGADALLIEAKAPAGADRPGGNATALDWSMLAGWSPPGSWLLAGGLTPDNVAAAVAASGASAVDVSSGVESESGIKDPARIARFISAARAA